MAKSSPNSAGPNGARARGTKQERAYDTIRSRIVKGTYGPGYRIVIGAVAEELGVSSLPVREAIRRLEAEGLVVYRPNAGAQVAPAEPVMYELEVAVQAVLEGYATMLAAPALKDQDLTELAAITDRMVEAMHQMNVLEFGKHNRAFHELIYSRCPNPALIDLLSEVSRRLDSIRRTVFVNIPYRGVESIEEHRKLISLLEQDASDWQIEKAARQHKLKTIESFRVWQQEQESGELTDELVG